MAELSEALNSTLQKMRDDPKAESFRVADVDTLELRLKEFANGYPCLRCDNASWLIQWLPPEPGNEKNKFGEWAGPRHVGCKAFLALPNFEDSRIIGFRKAFETDFFCTAEVNGNGSAGAIDTESSQRTRAQSSAEREMQEQTQYRRESDRG